MIRVLLNKMFRGDRTVWTIFLLLCAVSVLEVFSASSTLTYKGSYISPITKHVGLLLGGIVLTSITLNLKCRYFKITGVGFWVASIVLLVAVLVFGEDVNGAQRAMSICGLSFQPSEMAKGSLIICVAKILSELQGEEGTSRKAMKYVLLLTVPTCFLILLENLSTAVLLFAVIYMMMIIAQVPLMQILKLTGFITALVVFFIGVIMLMGNDTNAAGTASNDVRIENRTEQPKKEKDIFHRASTWKARIVKFFDDKEVAPEDFDLQSSDAQAAHANIAIVSSNYKGVGPGNSMERDFLPQAFSDFIYAIIIEEMGLEGAFLVVLLYVGLLFQTKRIAKRCKNSFPAYVAMGISLLLASQAMFNMLVAVGIAPVTGQPLPLISKGGTSTLVNCVNIGIILSVSLTAKKKKKSDARIGNADSELYDNNEPQIVE